jgi:hypothetical protein
MSVQRTAFLVRLIARLGRKRRRQPSAANRLPAPLQALVKSLQQKAGVVAERRPMSSQLGLPNKPDGLSAQNGPQRLLAVMSGPRTRLAWRAMRGGPTEIPLAMSTANQAVCPAYAKIGRGLLGIGSRISPSTFAASPGRHRSGGARLLPAHWNQSAPLDRMPAAETNALI